MTAWWTLVMRGIRVGPALDVRKRRMKTGNISAWIRNSKLTACTASGVRAMVARGQVGQVTLAGPAGLVRRAQGSLGRSMSHVPWCALVR